MKIVLQTKLKIDLSIKGSQKGTVKDSRYPLIF